MSRWQRAVLAGVALVAALWLGNSSWLHGAPGRPPLLLAHRGMAQTFPIAGLTGSEDTSKLIYPPEHPYLENTLASMAAAFARGADIVEVDVQRTADGQFAVFHDELLEFRTDGKGLVRAHSLAALKQLDVGFGYTADGGRTFPFRGKGVGLMPSLDEVLARFPERELLLDVKRGDVLDAEALAAFLAQLPPARLGWLAAYGGDAAMTALRHTLPALRVMSRRSLVRASLAYFALGWSGYLPEACRGTEIRLPLRFAPLFWGWPHRFVARLESVDTRVVLVSGDGRWSEGFDSLDSLSDIPAGYAGVIWTNRIDRIGPALKPR